MWGGYRVGMVGGGVGMELLWGRGGVWGWGGDWVVIGQGWGWDGYREGMGMR